jgi:mRNA interferase MazF
MKRGDIVLVRYPFTDLSSEKLRPALVLLPKDDEGDFLLAFITGVVRNAAFDITLKASETGLHRDSTLRLKKIMTIHHSLVAGRIGAVPAAQLEEIEKNLKMMLGL